MEGHSLSDVVPISAGAVLFFQNMLFFQSQELAIAEKGFMGSFLKMFQPDYDQDFWVRCVVIHTPPESSQ